MGSSIPVDRINELYRGEIFTEESARIARDRIHWMCAQVVGDTVLDVGCSQGITALLLAREGCLVTAIDTHPESVAFAREELARETPLVQGRVRLVETDLASLPDEPAFDTIVMGEVLEHQALPERFLRSGMTRLRAGGRLVITTPFALHPHPDHKISVFPRQIEALARRLCLVVAHLDVEDHYIRSVLLRPAERAETALPLDLLGMTERATLQSQQRLFDRLDERGEQLKKKSDALKITQRKLAEAIDSLDQSKGEAAKRTEQLRIKTAEVQQTREDAAAAAARHGAELGALQRALDATNARQREAQVRVTQLQAELEAAQAAHRTEVQNAAGELLTQRAALAAQEERHASELAIARRNADEGRQRQAVDAALRQGRVASEREAAAYLQRIAAVEASAEALQRSTPYRLGQTLVTGLKSGRGLRQLPGALWRLGSEVLQRRRQRSGGKNLSVDELRELLQLTTQSGADAVRGRIEAGRIGPSHRAAAFTQLSRELRSSAPAAAAEFARLAYAADPQPFRAKWLAFRLFDAGAIAEPVQLLLVGSAADLSASELRRTDEVRSLHRLQQQLPGWSESRAPGYVPRPGSLMYVSASCLPYHASGYSTRSQELLQALAATGLRVHAVTRPGYPWDRHDRQAEATGPLTKRGAVAYHHLRHPNLGLPLDSYLREAADALKREAVRTTVAGIHAASNHVNALPALIAARELGLPFAFEMRGLWELTRAAKIEGYERSERYDLNTALERHCALHADRVYVISGALRDHVLAWGVDAARVELLPNCVNSATIEAAASPAAARSAVLTLGYAGSVVHYEGLELLVDAMAQLRRDGVDTKAVIVGDGESLPALREHVKARSMADAIELRGRLEPEEARRVIARCDAVALPRLPHAVCEMIPPIKLVEAMAMGKPVVVPDLAVMREEVDDRRTGLIFKAGDVASLADALRQLATDPQRGVMLGHAAREHVMKERVWSRFAKKVATDQRSLQRRAAPALAATAMPLGADVPSLDITALMETYRRAGLPAVLAQLRDPAQALGERAQAARLLHVGKALHEAGHDEAEAELARAAVQIDASEQTLRGFFWAAQRARLFEDACETIGKLERLYGPEPTPGQHDVLIKLKRSPAFQLTVLQLLPTQPLERLKSEPRRICYVLHNSLPFSSGGYGTRSHGVAGGIQQAGYEVIILTRPGFPFDIKTDLDPATVPTEEVIDGIRYLRTPNPLRSGKTLLTYVTQSADALEQRLRELRPELVMAASNHVTALPALIAARRLGLPFVYEVRGLWEITRMSRDNDFEDSAAFAIQKLLEAKVAQNADHVFTLTEPMREELIARGVPSARIDLLPNSCDPDRFVPREKDRALAARLAIPDDAPVIGYIGTFVDYEGLEDLAAACALLKQRGVVFRLLMVGNENASGQERGSITESVLAAAASGRYSDWLILPGRVPHEDVESYYSLIDVAPFPRKPWPVCEMVSPMKPLEALAMEKAVVVSSVKALSEMIRDEETGLAFIKGDMDSLAATLERLLLDAPLRERLGHAGRRWVQAERTWTQAGAKFRLTLTTKHPGLMSEPRPATAVKDPEPPWWLQIDADFRARCGYVDVSRWSLSGQVQELRQAYLDRFAPETVEQRIPASNWARADICARKIIPAASLLDVGSGLGEFVNLAAMAQRHARITSVDLKDWDLWFDHTRRLNRIYRSVLELDESLSHDVVTCFEVIEHLQPDQLETAVAKLRSVARQKLYISVPFMEPLPLYRGHFTRFDAVNLGRLFPDARFTIFGKGAKDKVMAWILCEIDTAGHAPLA